MAPHQDHIPNTQKVPVLPPAGGGQGDKLGVYPLEVGVPALQGRRYLWTARAFAIGMYLSLVVNVALGSALFALVPLKTVEPMLVTFSPKNEQVVRVEPFQKGMPGFNLMTEKLAGEYVLMREAIVPDAREMARRWGGGGYIANRTSPEAYSAFQRNKQPVVKELIERGITRKVDIVAITPLSDTYFQVEYKTEDYNSAGTKVLQNYWQANLRVTYIPQQPTWEDRYVNPLGFHVLQYSVVKKNQ